MGAVPWNRTALRIWHHHGILLGPEQALSQTMQNAWISTVSQPTVDPVGEWPLFGDKGGVVENGGTFVELAADAVQIQEGVFNNRCDLLDALGWHNY